LPVRLLGAALILGLLLLNGTLQAQSSSSSGWVRAASPSHDGSSRASPLAASPTGNPIPTTLNIAGTWQDDQGNTYSISEAPNEIGVFYSMQATYLTDPSCPDIVGGWYIRAAWYGSQNTTVIAPGDGDGEMDRCDTDTAFDTACGLDEIWQTTFNATLTPNTITGSYLGQYYTYNTTSNGNIAPGSCKLSYYPLDTFTLTRVTNAANSSSSTSTSTVTAPPSTSGAQQSSESGSAQTSSRSTTTSTSSTSSTSTHSGTSGSLGLEIVAAGAVVVIAGIAVSVAVLRKRPA